MLVAACVLWSLAVARGWASSATGAGLVLAGYAVAARAFGEFFPSLVSQPIQTGFAGDPIVDLTLAVRSLGSLAFVFGLACTAAEYSPRSRVRRRAPSWVIPP